jgi:hypothetical protein
MVKAGQPGILRAFVSLRETNNFYGAGFINLLTFNIQASK